MSLLSAPPPPPPPGGNDPRKGGFGHNEPGSYSWINGDGSSKDQAQWVTGEHQKYGRHFIVHHRTEAIKWVRCKLRNAIEYEDMGYEVFDSLTGRRARFEFRGMPKRHRFEAFFAQEWDVILEERARIERHQTFAGESVLEGQGICLQT